MAKREFLMLAHTYKPAKHGIGGWWASEKLDGQRCFWDGGISRGLPKSEIPWANCEKDGRYLEEQIATGLWSRYGNVIHAPDDFLDQLPFMCLDGELWLPDYSPRQELMKIVKAITPGIGWSRVKYKAYGVPSFDIIFADGEIKNTNYKKVFKDIGQWLRDTWMKNDTPAYSAATKPHSPFKNHHYFMKAHIDPKSPVVEVHKQHVLPMQVPLAKVALEKMMGGILEKGGEGIVIRNPLTPWVAERSHTMLKVKPTDDAEGIVIGYTTGRKTDLGSKLLGKMGAMILDIGGGRRLELSGFTDMERELVSNQEGATLEQQLEWAECWAFDHPEEECPDSISAVQFPRGEVVTFKYRGLTKDKIPQEARYWRKDDRI